MNIKYEPVANIELKCEDSHVSKILSMSNRYTERNINIRIRRQLGKLATLLNHSSTTIIDNHIIN